MKQEKATRRDFLKNAVATGATIGGCAGFAGVFHQPGQADAAPLRPPGAVPEADFVGQCIRCMRCVEACPNNAIISLDDSSDPRLRKTPVIKARRQACMLCQGVEGEYLKCTHACPSGALQPIRNDPQEIREHVSMGTAVIDRDLCHSYNGWTCGTCGRACPLPGEALTIGMWERPEVNADACIGCGLCERACILYPQAIRVKPRGG